MTFAGWSGSVESLLNSEQQLLLNALTAHHRELLSMGSAASQQDAWREEIDILRAALQDCVRADERAATWSVILEFELPLEGGRRPDAVLLTGSSIAVLEFKQAAVPTRAAVDQAESYARDIGDYHRESHGHPVIPILILTRASQVAVDFDPVVITGSDELAHYLLESATPGEIDLTTWLHAPYEPLPTLVAAARRIFRDEPLPHVHAAHSHGIPQTLELIGSLVTDAESRSQRQLILVGGVPGSGKTLVGLRLVYERSETGGRGILLSGNGPLVEVLQHALRSRVFVRDLHAFIRTNGINRRTPAERIVVFDEAQRAWDRLFMYHKRGIEKSEPDLLVEIAERIPDWSVLVGLIGEGQEIYSGEEGGVAQWRDAILSSHNTSSWVVHSPPSLEDQFTGCDVRTYPELDLTASLRSRRANDLHNWVSHLLAGSLPLAARLAARITANRVGFPMYLTRDLDSAKSYARARYAEEPDKRYGLMVAAHARAPRRYGVDNHFMAMTKVKLGPWFNSPPDDPLSCCNLEIPVTEFQVQGLEVDLPIVCWGEDFLWTGSEWQLRPARARYPQRDPHRLLTNAYRVLLTRGRDGLLVFIPPEDEFDHTEHALLAAGLKPLEEAEEEVREAVGNGS
jgi:Uncharacterized conserved protein (DUF2075)